MGPKKNKKSNKKNNGVSDSQPTSDPVEVETPEQTESGAAVPDSSGDDTIEHPVAQNVNIEVVPLSHEDVNVSPIQIPDEVTENSEASTDEGNALVDRMVPSPATSNVEENVTDLGTAVACPPAPSPDKIEAKEVDNTPGEDCTNSMPCEITSVPMSVAASMESLLVVDDAPEAWEVKLEKNKEEKQEEEEKAASEIKAVLASLGLSEEEANFAEPAEAWECKVEQKQEEKKEALDEVERIRQTLGLSENDLAESDVGVEAWEKKAVQEKVLEADFAAEDEGCNSTKEDAVDTSAHVNKQDAPVKRKSFWSYVFGEKKQ